MKRWAMEKIGSICRTVEDCALVLKTIYGPDGPDQNVFDVPFNYNPEIDLSKLRIGYLKKDFEQEKDDKERNGDEQLDTSKQNDEATLAKLRALGAQLIPISFIGRLFDEGTVLAVEKKYQDVTRFHLQHPSLPD